MSFPRSVLRSPVGPRLGPVSAVVPQAEEEVVTMEAAGVAVAAVTGALTVGVATEVAVADDRGAEGA